MGPDRLSPSASLWERRICPRIGSPLRGRAPATPANAAAFVEEALRWLPESPESIESIDSTRDDVPPRPAARESARILLVDDNADLRDYLRKILGTRWVVETAADGDSALEVARRTPPDLILTDVMMPGLTGFDLLRELRADPLTRSIRIVMLSARAGEEARVEGLDAGADDYLIKPFSARELIARVSSQLTISASNRELAFLWEREHTLRREADAANRAKDQFLAMLSHELRNPLSPMLTALELMRLRGYQSREQDILERQVGHLTRLVDDLLDISRITQGKIELRKQPIELAEVMAKAIEISSPLFEQRRHHLDVRVPRRGLGLNVDPDRMAQVISNLLTNAAKYSEKGSQIIVAATREGDRVQIRVRDEGVGIAPEIIDRVFDLFVQEPQTLDRSKGGLGLGLTIVRSLVALHGGTVRANSEGIGKGSEFVVELPAVDLGDVHVAEPSTPDITRRPAHTGGKRILVVDDNEDVLETLREALEELGHVVEVAHDGPSALKMAEVFEPEIALLDMGLPVMDGYELALRLRERANASHRLRLIAVTGYGQEADRQRSAAAGFDMHLVKPVDLEKLGRIVEESG